MLTSIIQLGWRTLLRDLRAGELRLLAVAVTLAVAALTSVAFFADRLQGGLQRDALQILGGDAVVASDNPTPEPIVQRAQALGLQTVTTVGFPTMGRASDVQGGAARLVAFKSVQPGYPLRGSLTVADAPGAEERKTRDIPAPGEVWVDAPLLEALGLQMGDALLLGDASLRIARIIVVEPDRGAGFMAFAPRVMVNDADVPATGLVQPASRLTYRFAVAGEPPAVRDFSAWAAQELEKPGVRGVRLESLESGRPEMQQTLDRAQKFLSLVALLAALLSAVAVALAATSTPRPCCACWARASAPSRAATRLNSCWWGWPPVPWACCWAMPCTMALCCCWPGWLNRACPPPAPGRWRWAWAWGSRCSSPLACHRCCSWPRCRRCS